jgi:hypothetical protein
MRIGLHSAGAVFGFVDYLVQRRSDRPDPYAHARLEECFHAARATARMSFAGTGTLHVNAGPR